MNKELKEAFRRLRLAHEEYVRLDSPHDLPHLRRTVDQYVQTLAKIGTKPVKKVAG